MWNILPNEAIAEQTNSGISEQLVYEKTVMPDHALHPVLIATSLKFFAIDTELDLQAGANKNQLLEAMKEHILFRSELMGYYQKRKTMTTK